MATAFPDTTYSWYLATGSVTRASNADYLGPAEKWATELIHAIGEASFWSRFMSESENSIIQNKIQWGVGQGDYFHFHLINALSNAPIDNSYEAWGSEEVPSTAEDTVQAGLVRHAVKIPKPMFELQSPYNIRRELYTLQKQWWIEYGIDKWITRKLSGLTFYDAGGTADSTDNIGENATANSSILYGGSATSTATVTDSDVFLPELLSKAKISARVGVKDAAGNAIWKMRPIMTDGGEYYVAVLHPYQVYSMKHNAASQWKEAQLQAGVRGPENLIFRGTGGMAGQLPQPVGIWDGVLIYEYPNIATATDWGDTGAVQGATGLFLGAQAGLFGWALGPQWIEEDYFYDEYYGVMVRVVAGFDKAMFAPTVGGTARDHAVIALKTAAKHPYANA